MTESILSDTRETALELPTRQRIFDLTPLPATLKLQSSLYRYVLKATERWATSQVPAHYARSPDQWALEKIRLELMEMERLGREHGFTPYFFVVPPQAAYLADEHASSCADLAQVLRRDGQLREALHMRPGFIDFELGRRGEPSVNERMNVTSPVRSAMEIASAIGTSTFGAIASWRGASRHACSPTRMPVRDSANPASAAKLRHTYEGVTSVVGEEEQ